MALHISKERIAERDLTDLEVAYLQQRNRLPKNYFDEGPAAQESPTIGDSGGIEDDDEDEADYEDGWNNDQRRAALAKRKLSVDGKKDELIARLRRSDAGQLTDDDYSTLED